MGPSRGPGAWRTAEQGKPWPGPAVGLTEWQLRPGGQAGPETPVSVLAFPGESPATPRSAAQ